MFGISGIMLLAMAIGQTDAAPKENGWQPIFQKMAEEYVIQTSDSPSRTIELKKSPILRWSQPVRGGDDGATFVWMDQGRPAVIGTIFAYPNANKTRTIVHEFHSLARTGLDAKYSPKIHWTPMTAGVTLNEIPKAPVPADKPAARLSQMRTILRDFSARSIDPNDRAWELRLLPQPLVRYETDQNELAIDGAVFAFAQGTDPEILLVIEAQRISPEPVWKYGCGRFSDYRLELKHNDDLVWSIGRSNFGSLDGVYFATDVDVRNAPPGATIPKDRKSSDVESDK